MIQTDKRVEPRIFDRVGISINVMLGDGLTTAHEFANDVTIDISENGLRFYDVSGLPDGALLEIFMTPEGVAQPISQLAKVRWRGTATDRDGFEIGVKFVAASRPDRAVWLDYVRQRLMTGTVVS